MYNLDPVSFCSTPGLAQIACLKKPEIKLELLTDIDTLLMVETRIRRGIFHAIHQYVEASNKYMKEYNKAKESSYLIYLDANNLYGQAMSQSLPVHGLKWKKLWQNSIELHLILQQKGYKNYDNGRGTGFIFELDAKYCERL